MLKKFKILIILLLFFIFTNNSIFFKGFDNINILDFQTSFLFLNISKFEEYRVSAFNIRLIIQFVSFILLSVYILYDEKKQYHSFLLLQVYRLGRKKIWSEIVKTNTKNCIQLVLILILCNVISLIFYMRSQIFVIPFLDFCLFLIYVIKLFIIFNGILIINDVFSILSKSTGALTATMIGAIFLIMIDVSMKINILSIGSTIIGELLIILIWSIVFLFSYLILWRKLIMKGEIS